jgi:c-di-GMP-binding flagellar brake protein YcgR
VLIEALHAGAPRWKNLRCFPRFALEVPLTLTNPRLLQPLPGRMADIGLGGLCATFAEAAPLPGERVLVEFTLPQMNAPLRILSRVRYHNASRLGVQFLSITAEQREQIRSACSTLTIV